MSHRRKRRPEPSPPPAARRRESLVPFVLALTLAAATLAVDVRAESPFDAPKRLAATAGCALATGLAFWRARRASPGWRDLRPASRWTAGLFLGALAACGLSAALSPRRGAALDSWRQMLVFALALPLGASLTASGFRIAALGFFAAAIASALLALAETAGWRLPLPVVSVSGRSGTGAMLGNEGLLSIVLAIAAVAALAVLLGSGRTRDRRLAAASLVPIAAVLVINRNLTSAIAVAAGAAVVGFRLRGRRALSAAAALAVIASAGIALYPPARGRVREAAAYLRAGDWNRLLSYREGPWVAAVEMIRERPLAGWGPGTFGAEFVPHRLSAEIRRRSRFVNPRAESAYVEAHNDYLQAAAEAGLPAAGAAVAALVLLVTALLRRARGGSPGLRAAAAGLAAVLCAGAVSALTWFPLQRPASSLPLLIAAGRAWRVADRGEEEAA